MCAQEPYGIPRYGSREAVEALRVRSSKIWETAIQTARIEILAIGDCNPEEIRPVLKQRLPIARDPRDVHPMQVVKTVSEVKEETEQMAVAQSKLVMGFRPGASAAEEDAFLHPADGCHFRRYCALKALFKMYGKNSVSAITVQLAQTATREL